MIDLAAVCYTHSRCADVWPVFARQSGLLGRIHRYCLADQGGGIDGWDWLRYDDGAPFCEQIRATVGALKDQYILWMQEDFLLYAPVDWDVINAAGRLVMNARDMSFLRLIKSGEAADTERRINRFGRHEIFLIPWSAPNSFAFQPTIWRRTDFLRVIEASGITSIRHEPEVNRTMARLRIDGAYIHSGGRQRGRLHWDSGVFPCICTAINKGKWNLSEYKFELGLILEEAGIDPAARGAA